MTGCSREKPTANNMQLAIARKLPKLTALKPVVLIPFALSWSDPSGGNLLGALRGPELARPAAPLPLLDVNYADDHGAVPMTSNGTSGGWGGGSAWYFAGLPAIVGLGASGSGGGPGGIGWGSPGSTFSGGIPTSRNGGTAPVSSDFNRHHTIGGDGPSSFNGGSGVNTFASGGTVVTNSVSRNQDGNSQGENDQGNSFNAPSGPSITGTGGWSGNGEFSEFSSDVGAPGGSVPNFSAPTFNADFSLQIDEINNPDTDQDLAPEPSAMMMVGLGLIGLTGVKRRRRK
ncbi:MAG TPA: PEP-CTERM sorting domain-containing protein [Gemmatimonadales bacterium]|jgi:hypothetical protein